MAERPGSDGVDPASVTTGPVRPQTRGSVAMGRVLLGVGDIIEGKPPRSAYEYVVEADDSGEPGEPEDPGDLVVKV